MNESSLRELGMDLLEERQFERALAVFAEAVRRVPADHRSRMMAARCASVITPSPLFGTKMRHGRRPSPISAQPVIRWVSVAAGNRVLGNIARHSGSILRYGFWTTIKAACA